MTKPVRFDGLGGGAGASVFFVPPNDVWRIEPMWGHPVHTRIHLRSHGYCDVLGDVRDVETRLGIATAEV